MQQSPVLQKTISITAISSVSTLGHDPDKVWQNYLYEGHKFIEAHFSGELTPAAFLDAPTKMLVGEIQNSNTRYKSLDKSVLYAIAASRLAVATAGWKAGDNFGINIGSSRGATELFEKYHSEFISSGKTGTLASPVTTLGNISSWVAHDLQSAGPEISHSITCSTSLHALLNGIAWIRSGMADKFLVGGSEAPLTPFTIAQMKAMKIYGKGGGHFPCRAMDFGKTGNSMILGEGASVCCLEPEKTKNALAYITGIGYATELLDHPTSISTNAECFQKSMAMALGKTSVQDIDAIVMHAPGTIAGDNAEYNAIIKVFGKKLPMLTTNKWKIGHTFGASGMLSVEMAVMMMKHQQFVRVPFAQEYYEPRKSLRKILVNSVGFGGNAVSIVLEKPED